jgi:Glycosyl hydrolase family 26
VGKIADFLAHTCEGPAARSPPWRGCWVSVEATVLTVVMSAYSVHAAPRPRLAAFGAFLGSDECGVARIPAFEHFAGYPVRVGHTYLAGTDWEEIAGPDWVLGPWSAWRRARPERLLVLNVPMLAPNEPPAADHIVASQLRHGATGAFDAVFHTLATRLIAYGVPDTILVPGWEMNGQTYSHRCAPDPEAWKAYWRRIVAVMRAVPGAAFRFDFAPNRGPDVVGWERAYPGDDVVDIIGMDCHDQGPGESFADYVHQPYGLGAQVTFAAAHGKPVSYPEWGLFRYGDRPEFITAMLSWIAVNNVVYHTLTDYCPYGVFDCQANPRSAAAFQKAMAAWPAAPVKTAGPSGLGRWLKDILGR